MYYLKSNQRGDTIIEVLIAIAIASAVLGGAYAFTNRASKGTLQSQEHVEATRLVESQIERLRKRIDDGGSIDTSFCFNSTGNYTLADPCSFTGLGDFVYSVSVTSVPGGGSLGGFIYTARAEWPSVNSGTDRVEMVYKAYP